MSRRCTLTAGHGGAHRWVTVSAARRLVSDPCLTPSEPPCIQSLIDRREAEVRSGCLVREAREKREA